MQITLKFLYMLAVCFWVGSIFFFSFFAAPSIFKVLPREAAGNVVSDIFPKYYLVAYICGAIAIITSILQQLFYKHKSGVLFAVRIGGLVAMLAIAVYAGEVVRPQAHESREEMRSLTEASPHYPASHEKFRQLHARSAILNSAVFFLGIAILFLNAYNKE